jgi:two-component system, chemotaxis family, sensor kinase CheA
MSEAGPIARDEFFDSLLGDFLDESAQLLDRLNENLLQLDEWVRDLSAADEPRDNAQVLNEMFRAAHSLKGLSAMLGLTDINGLTHKVENVFDAARKNELAIDADVVDLVFQAVDRLTGLVETLKDPHAEPVNCDSVLEGIRNVLQSAGVERKQTSQADAERALQAETAAAPVAAVPEAMAPVADAPAIAVDVAPVAAPLPPEAAPAAMPAPAASSVVADKPPLPLPDVDHFANLHDEIENASKYVSIFVDETEMSLDQLTECLLAVEGRGTPQTLEHLLVTSHRIKGSAASVGLNRPAKLAHLMEDLLQNLREEGRPLTPRLIDALLACTDGLRRYVEGLKRGHPESREFNQLAHQLLTAQAGETAAAAPAAAKETTSPAKMPMPECPAATPRAEEGIPKGLRAQVSIVSTDHESTLVGRVTFQPNLALVGLKARLVYEKLTNLGEIRYFQPPAEGLDDLESLDGISFGLLTDKPLAEVQQKLRIAGVERATIEPLLERADEPITAAAPPAAAATDTSSAPKVAQPLAARPSSAEALPAAEPAESAGAAATAKSQSADAGSKPTETLRVDIERLDQLMNLAGQLVINKARFCQIGDRLKQAVTAKQSSHSLGHVFATLEKIANTVPGEQANLRLELDNIRGQARRVQGELEAVRRDVEVLSHMRTSVNDLFESIHQLELVSNEIQKSVMDTRMLPIGPLFTRFKRVIRDITRGNGKQINLVINGEKTELDKRMIDELGDPLIHMVRNSADHGIELPEVREAAGKPRQGTVTLDAFHRGNSIVIQVTDDGKGLDPDRIAKKAVEKGLITTADLEKMTRQQIYQLIWEPGLSTAEKVTEVSGRGMGMDIVKSKIEDLNGTVDLESEPGQWTRMTIKLPLTLAILPSLMVEIDGDVYAMPLESVVEIVSLKKRDLGTVYGKRIAQVRGRVVATTRLDDVFSWAACNAPPCREAAEEVTLVIVGATGRELGLTVDQVLGEEDIVIKSMADNYRNVAGIAGASILGDGRVSLILDLAALIDMASTKRTAAAVS